MKKVIVFGVMAVAALFSLMAPQPTYADFKKVKINVVGMTCEFCERALEKNLARVPGVESARAWLDKGIAEVKLKNGAKLDLEKLARAVRDGGLTLKDIEVTAAGNLTEQEGKPALKVSGNEQLLRLKLADQRSEAMKGAKVTVVARIAAEKVKHHVWEVKEINKSETR